MSVGERSNDERLCVCVCVKPGEREREREEKGGECVYVCVCEGVDPGKKKSVCVEGVVVCGRECVGGRRRRSCVRG